MYTIIEQCCINDSFSLSSQLPTQTHRMSLRDEFTPSFLYWSLSMESFYFKSASLGNYMNILKTTSKWIYKILLESCQCQISNCKLLVFFFSTRYLVGRRLVNYERNERPPAPPAIQPQPQPLAVVNQQSGSTSIKCTRIRLLCFAPFQNRIDCFMSKL